MTAAVGASAALAQSGIDKAFYGVKANDDVDFDLRWGEVHALLGENGAGKSTLCSIIAGLYRPDSGEMRFDGIGEIMDVDDRLLDPGIAEPIEDVIEQGAARNLYERLGRGRRQRPHPLAEPGGHYHRGFDPWRIGLGPDGEGRGVVAHDDISPFQAEARFGVGTEAENHAVTGASAGWRRSRSRYFQTRA